ncbi:MAG: NYN domain-containing protein [Candidatus Hydrogenedentota bacterium]
MHYYIDGYNVLYTSDLLRSLARTDFEVAREALIDKVAVFSGTTDNRVSVVFDGLGKTRGEVAAHGRGVDRLEVIYTHGELSADAFIEREVYQAGSRRSVVVVSSDRGIRNLCQGLGAMVMDGNNFLQSVRAARAEIDRNLEQRRKQHTTLGRMEDCLGTDTRDRLKALRDKLR